MVIEEHFVTRRPVLFLVIVILALIVIYLPAKYAVDTLVHEETRSFINETYDETWRWFSPGSPLDAEEKEELFNIKYRGNFVEWQGEFLECRELENLWSVRVKQRDLEGFADVVFSTKQNCSIYQPGLMIRYRTQLTDLKVNVFVGKNGMILS